MSAVRPYLKAVLPALLTLIAVLVQWAVTGVYDKAELATTLTGLLASLVTFLAKNDDPLPALDLVPPAKLKVDRVEPDEKRPRRRR
jgi:hypothetical protein